jgi:hypothetical protein
VGSCWTIRGGKLEDTCFRATLCACFECVDRASVFFLVCLLFFYLVVVSVGRRCHCLAFTPPSNRIYHLEFLFVVFLFILLFSSSRVSVVSVQTSDRTRYATATTRRGPVTFFRIPWSSPQLLSDSLSMILMRRMIHIGVPCTCFKIPRAKILGDTGVSMFE